MQSTVPIKIRSSRLFSALGLPIILVCALLFFFFLHTPVAEAADPKPTIRDAAGYAASFVSQSEADPIVMEQGETKLVKIRFRNVGSQSWNNEGPRYISAYTMEPRYRDSLFVGPGWVSPRQIGRMAGVIAPGEVGELGVFLHAPDQVGEYTEEFYLAAENYSWLSGGYFYLKIQVVPKEVSVSDKKDVVEQKTDTPEISAEEAILYKAKQIMMSKRKVTAVGGEEIKLIIGYQNLGETPWTSFSLKATAPSALAAEKSVTFADASWKGSATITKGNVAVEPFGVLKESFVFRAPVKAGEYTAQFVLTIDETHTELIQIPVTVTSNAPSSYVVPSFDEEEEIIPFDQLEVPRLAAEPRIRVGLWKPEIIVQVISYQDDYIVKSGDTVVGTLPAKHVGFLGYDQNTKEYTFSGSDLDVRSLEYIRLEPANNPHAVFELLNYDRHVRWKGPGNFNRYRGAVEYRMGEFSDDIWIVNDLLLHDYAKGIGENSNGSPMEYLKAQSVAQVTYAYAIQQSDKHGIFDVVATTADQLYLGYYIEEIMPRFVEAVDAVRGYMVTYQGQVVITPYFAHTDGKTRSWDQVWGGSVKPWLVSVKAEYDAGRSLFGHGVGMSQIDASQRAQKEGLDWRALLEYYYTGTQQQKMYF